MRHVAKLANGYAPKELLLRAKAKRHAKMASATVDLDGLYQIRKTAIANTLSIMDLKYFYLEYWIQDALYRAFRLNVHNMRGRYILDLGTGFGYFPYICNYWGNKAYGLDREGHKLYDQVTDLLSIPKTLHTIKPFEPLPSIDGQRFDLITGFQIGFNMSLDGEVWSGKEWDFFLNDLIQNVAAPGGRIVLELNYLVRQGYWADAETLAVFRRYGGNWRLGRLTVNVPR